MSEQASEVREWQPGEICPHCKGCFEITWTGRCRGCKRNVYDLPVEETRS